MKQKIKMGIDFLMTVLLLSLMAYQITGQKFHEWFGTGMLVLFIAHNVLNIKWYGSLFKGKYTPMRTGQTIINFGILISMLCLGFSGIIMSRHVFAALPINGPMAVGIPEILTRAAVTYLLVYRIGFLGMTFASPACWFTSTLMCVICYKPMMRSAFRQYERRHGV